MNHVKRSVIIKWTQVSSEGSDSFSVIKYFQMFGSKDGHLEVLKQSPLLADLSYRELREFLKLAKTNFFTSNERIISEGSYDNSLYFIASGQVKVFRKGKDEETLELCKLGPGDFFGELTLLDDLPRSASITSLSDTELLYIERDPFFEFSKKYPKVLSKILKEVSMRFRKSNDTFFENILQKNREIQKAYEKLKSLDEAKSKFITLASHELRTPITIMISSLSLIRDGVFGKQEENIEKTVDMCLKNATKLKEVTDKIIDVAMNNNVESPLTCESFALKELIKCSLEDISVLLSKRNLEVKTQVDSDIQVNADFEKIKQTITNILLNAIRFTNDGGSITIKAEQSEFQIKISVTDTGVGIEDEKIGLIFTPFYKVGEIETHSSGDVEFGSGGIGLGLTIAKNFVDLHKGKIDVESKKNEGSTFTVSLPNSTEL